MLQGSPVPFPNNGYQSAGKITQNRLKRYTWYRSDPTWILSTPVSNKLTNCCLVCRGRLDRFDSGGRRLLNTSRWGWSWGSITIKKWKFFRASSVLLNKGWGDCYSVLVEKLKFILGQARFWRWNLSRICVRALDMTSRSYFGKMNSTLGSVVPLAMFFIYAVVKCSGQAIFIFLFCQGFR